MPGYECTRRRRSVKNMSCFIPLPVSYFKVHKSFIFILNSFFIQVHLLDIIEENTLQIKKPVYKAFYFNKILSL